MIDRFSWRSYDLRTILPRHWQEQILTVADTAVRKTLRPLSVTSREGDENARIAVMTVNGQVVRRDIPWLHDLYLGLFKDLANVGVLEPVVVAENDIYGAVINVQRGQHMRYECHIDSNPIEGLLYVTDHPKGSGGELVVANNQLATSIEDVEADCTIVYPTAGNLVFFDARRFPHYVRALNDNTAVRVVVAMNFYTPSSPESARPADLDKHLFGHIDKGQQ